MPSGRSEASGSSPTACRCPSSPRLSIAHCPEFVAAFLHRRCRPNRRAGELRSAEQLLHVPNAELASIEAVMANAPHGWRGGASPPAQGPPLPALGREAVEV